MSQVTKRALVASLKNQLLKKPLDKVTISDITDDCGISRMTFYYHFKDIYDLIEWAFEEEASRILEGKKDYDTWQQGYLRIFEDLNANKPFIMNVYRSISREKVENYLYRITYDLLIHVINEKAKGMNVRDEDKKFLANFYKYAFVGLVLDWIKHDMKDESSPIFPLQYTAVSLPRWNGTETLKFEIIRAALFESMALPFFIKPPFVIKIYTHLPPRLKTEHGGFSVYCFAQKDMLRCRHKNKRNTLGGFLYVLCKRQL